MHLCDTFLPCSNHPQLAPVLSGAVSFIKRLLAVHSVAWAKQQPKTLPAASDRPLPKTADAKLRQKGDHVALTEDVAIAVHNMSTLLMHATQHTLRSDCAAVMRSAPLCFLNSVEDPENVNRPSMPHSLNALASIFPAEVIEGVLGASLPANGGQALGAAPEATAQWQVGALVTAKCPATKTFRVAKVVQANERSVQVQFTMPDRSLLCASYPGKLLRAVVPKGAKGWPAPSRDGDHGQLAGGGWASKTPPAPDLVVSEDVLSLCSLALLPSIYQDRHYEPLFSILLRACNQKCSEYCALLAINALASNASFVAYMSSAQPDWIARLTCVAIMWLAMNRGVGALDRSYHDVATTTVVSIFDSLLRSAASADQRRSFIDVMLRAGIVHALFEFCQGRDSPSAARDTAACAVLSCAGISPSSIAINWLRRSFREPRQTGSGRGASDNFLQNVSVSWTASVQHSDDDFDEQRCVISVERCNLIASSVKSFGFCALEGLAKKLKVHFVLERGCDAGGLTVEWLHLLLDAVLSDVAFFLPVLLPNGQPSGIMRVNHSAALATTLPASEVFRMIGCCLALCLQVGDIPITNMFQLCLTLPFAVGSVRQQPVIFGAFCAQVHHACSIEPSRLAVRIPWPG